MKKFFIASFLLGAFFVSTQEVVAQEKDPIKVVLADSTSDFGFTLDAMAVINNKCYGCHSPNARGDKSKKALMWLELQSMEKTDLVGKLDEVMEVLEEGSMPPEKLIEKYPNMKLTEEELSTLKTWTEGQLNALMDE